VAHVHDVVVVGAGMAGLAAARALARDGQDVLMLEQFRLGHDRGSSHGSSRIWRLSHDDPAEVERARRAFELWRELEAETGEPLLETTGGVDLWDDLSGHEAALSAAGVPYELLDAAELERRFSIRAHQGPTAMFQADGGIAYADRAIAALERSARMNGATILEEARVEAIEADERGIAVESAAGRHEARAVVVAAGAWAKALLEPLGIDLPVEVTRETVVYFRGAADGLPTVIEATSSTIHEGYALKAPGIGLKAGIHRSGAPADPDVPGEPDPEIVSRVAAWVAERLPVDDARPVRAETCLYTSTPNEQFVLERHGRVVVGSACSGRGFKFAPLTGRVLADLASEVL
jgi:sarcosine oxidase